MLMGVRKASRNGVRNNLHEKKTKATGRNRSEDHNSSIPEGDDRDLGIPRRKRTKRVDNNVREHPDVFKRVKELQSSLATEFPSEIRIMLPSYVSGCFWLQLGKRFWHLHLPHEDAEMTLEDENGKEYRAKYIWTEMALCGGWKGFSVAHKLDEGDALIFQLMRPAKFKVYIVRADDFQDEGGASDLKSDCCSKGVNSDDFTNGKEIKVFKVKEDCGWDCLAKDIPMENIPEDNHKEYVASKEHVLHKLEHTSDNLVPEVLGGITFSKRNVCFKEVRSIMKFSVVVNSLVIYSELSKQVRHTYYELCCSQQSFLHGRLLEGLNYKLAAGIISEAVNIADATRASTITTFTENLFVWCQTLKAIEDMGMNVGFIRARLAKLLHLAVKWKRYRESRRELTTLESKLFKAKEAATIDDEIETLEKDGRKLEMAFQQVVNAPW